MAQIYLPLFSPGDRVETDRSNNKFALFGTVLEVCYPSVVVRVDTGDIFVTPILVWDFELPF